MILAGCGLAGVQTYRLESQKAAQLEAEADRANLAAKLALAEKTMREKEQRARVERHYPAAAPAAMPPPMHRDKDTVPVGKKETTVTEITEVFTKQLFSAALAFIIPDTANIKEEIKAQLLINPGLTPKELEKELTKTGVATSRDIKVSRVVKATITAPDFDVTRITDEEQILTDDQSTEWLWSLAPRSAGSHEVSLTVTAIITTAGRESRHHIKTFEKTMTIAITPAQVLQDWWSRYWQWVVSTLILPFGLWLYKKKLTKAED